MESHCQGLDGRKKFNYLGKGNNVDEKSRSGRS